MRSLTAYLARLSAPRIILWCYLIWYLTIVACHFDPNPTLWINSAGISLVIGTGLVLSVIPAAGLAAMPKWQIARLFMMPLAVSSFAAIIKDRGFFVIFSPLMRENLMAAGACLMFIVVALACRRMHRPAPGRGTA